jgi:hypothetical protein
MSTRGRAVGTFLDQIDRLRGCAGCFLDTCGLRRLASAISSLIIMSCIGLWGLGWSGMVEIA